MLLKKGAISLSYTLRHLKKYEFYFIMLHIFAILGIVVFSYSFPCFKALE